MPRQPALLAALAVATAIPATSQTIPASPDFVVCAAYSRLLGEMYERRKDVETSVQLKLRARTLLNLAIELDLLDSFPEVKTRQSYTSLVAKLRSAEPVEGREQRWLFAYDSFCPGIVDLARKIAPRFPEHRLTR